MTTPWHSLHRSLFPAASSETRYCFPQLSQAPEIAMWPPWIKSDVAPMQRRAGCHWDKSASMIGIAISFDQQRSPKTEYQAAMPFSQEPLDDIVGQNLQTFLVPVAR